MAGELACKRRVCGFCVWLHDSEGRFRTRAALVVPGTELLEAQQ